jgi:hypothetical protein
MRIRCWALRAATAILVACVLLAGCQKGEPKSADEGVELLKEMKAWFEATDYEAYGFATLEEALDDFYQDDGYTSMLYGDIGLALEKPSSDDTNRRAVLKECQEWFELIDYEMSGYETLDEAIRDIFQDGGETLDLYKKLVEYNSESA